MKIHKATFEEINQPGSIWAAVSMAKQEHRSVLRYKRQKDWSMQDYCRIQRDTMMHTIRVIARGLLVTCERSNSKLKRSKVNEAPKPDESVQL